MKWVYKFCLINIGFVYFIAIVIALSSGINSTDLIAITGLLSLLWSAVSVVLGLLLLVLRRRQWGQGFLLSAGILLLLGFLECSFSGLNIQ